MMPMASMTSMADHTADAAKCRVRKACALSLAARSAWLFLRDEGGWWTPGELGRSLLPNSDHASAAKVAARWLYALQLRGHIARNPRSKRTPCYGVTASCLPIPGQSLEPSAAPHQAQAEQA